MTNYEKKNHSFSLHMFRALVESMSKAANEKNYIKKQKELLKSSGINSSLNNKKTKEIRLKCNFLGENGWVISPFWEPRENETWYDTWFWKAYNDSADSIAEYYRYNDYALLKNINWYSRFEVSRNDWFIEAEELFEMKKFTSCSMMLTAILEESIRKCPIDTWKQQITIFFDMAIKTKVEDYYNNLRIEPISEYIDTVLLLPSINAFIIKYFNSGHRFGQSKEPNFIERNWLMHGMSNRNITESDCIKLFNIICSLHYVINKLFQKTQND